MLPQTIFLCTDISIRYHDTPIRVISFLVPACKLFRWDSFQTNKEFKQSNVDQLQLLHLAPLQVISRLHSLNFQNCRLTKSGAAHLDTYQRASIKLLPSECQIYVLAGSACRYQIGYFRNNLLIHRQGDGWIMNVERPKNGTERALILHSWLVSTWTWAWRHIFRISHTHTQVSPLGPELYPPNLARSLTSLCRLPQSVWTPSISPSPPSHHRDPPPSLSPLLAVWGNLEFSSEVHLLLDFYF